MSVNSRKRIFPKDIVLHGEEGETVVIPEDNIAFFYLEKSGELTRLFLMQSTASGQFTVRESIETICDQMTKPVVVLDCHEDEENCYKVAVPVANIAAYIRDSDNSLTTLFMRRRDSGDDRFYIQQTPEQILDLVNDARAPSI